MHLNLSETDNDDLMMEILFKLIILRFVDSYEKIYYLGYNVNIIIEIPNSFIDFDKKYLLLKSFKRIHINELSPLRLEENIKKIGDSPISIVAEVLSLYDSNRIETQNINLEQPIRKTAAECEEIINRHFKVKNKNYYQKINFIKILSVQFKKFTNCIYLNYDLVSQDEAPNINLQNIKRKKENLIKKARKNVIKNFIELTKVFTHSPFDTILLNQNKSMELFGTINENDAKMEEIQKLSNEVQEVFSFKKIKPSLVFFNRDGHSFSIISNNDKNDQEYKDLLELWNSQNPELYNNLNNPKWNDLIDYKNMKHEYVETVKKKNKFKKNIEIEVEHKDFLFEIQKLFSLDNFNISQIKQICEEKGNYTFTSDNYIKMVRILLNIEAKIPVILMGETGVGKTKLLEMLATLYGKGKLRWKKLNIHAGTTDQDIVSFIEKTTKEIERDGKENEVTWIFFDELNTCKSLGLLTEIMCNHTCLGKKINENFIFLGACNPYRLLTKNMRKSGLIYYNMKEKNLLNNLIYTVNTLPHSLLNFIFDFGSLQSEDEKNISQVQLNLFYPE